MRTAALIPLLCLLASSTFAEHSNGDAIARRHNSRRHHGAMVENVKRQEVGEERTLAGKRIVRKRGQVCRVRPGSASAASSSSSTASPSVAATSQFGDSNNFAAAASSATTAAAQVASSAVQAAASPSPEAAKPVTPAQHNSGGLTPNGKKAGMSAGDSVNSLGGMLGWYYNWAPTEPWPKDGRVTFVPTLWGGGSADSVDAERLTTFKQMSSTPTYLIGPNEPDCAAGGQMSSDMSIDATAALWNDLMVPKANAGTLLLSPSMCKQMAENGWLAEFQTKIHRDFDITNVHINKNSMEGVKAVIDYYYNKYKKPIWVTEFACVNDSPNFVPCTDQGQINQFIHDIVDVLENDDRVHAYAYSNGHGLGNVWPSWNGGGLSESGKAYQSALSKYYH